MPALDGPGAGDAGGILDEDFNGLEREIDVAQQPVWQLRDDGVGGGGAHELITVMRRAFQILKEESKPYYRPAEEGRKFIKCREGWISYVPSAGGRYLVRATGCREETVTAVDLHGVLREMERRLGGRIRSS